MGPEFSPGRRNALKTLMLGGVVAVTPKPFKDFAKTFEKGEQDPEKEHINNCLTKYNKEYPTIKDKFTEQKKWFLGYMDSKLYKKLLTEEMKRFLFVSDKPTKEEKEGLKKFVEDELKDRKFKVENVRFFIDHSTVNNTDAYETILNIDDISNVATLEYVGNKDDLPKEGNFFGVIVNEIPFNSDCLNNFEGVTTFCHEMHHVSLAKMATKTVDPFERTNKIFEERLLSSDLDSSKIEPTKEVYVLRTIENMARIIAVRRTLQKLGKMNAFKDEFNEKHIEYIKKHLDDLFPKTSYVRYLFSGDLKKDNKEIENKVLLEIMNSFADVSIPSDLNGRIG